VPSSVAHLEARRYSQQSLADVNRNAVNAVNAVTRTSLTDAAPRARALGRGVLHRIIGERIDAPSDVCSAPATAVRAFGLHAI